jgi:hypothetical protein
MDLSAFTRAGMGKAILEPCPTADEGAVLDFLPDAVARQFRGIPIEMLLILRVADSLYPLTATRSAGGCVESQAGTDQTLCFDELGCTS